MKVLSFLNNKGGVGKTASVTNIAYILASVYQKKVLAVDLDPQGNLSNFYGNTDFVKLLQSRRAKKETAESMVSVGELLINSDLDVHKAIRKTNYEGLDILPSFPTLSAVEERLKADITTPQQFRLRNQLEKVKGEYDYCLIDCSPSLSILNVNALVASDEVYIPTLADDGSLFGIELTKTELIDEVKKYSPKLKLGGIFFTRYRKNLNVSKYAVGLLGAAYAKLVLPLSISESVKVTECTYKHVPLLKYDRRCRAAQDYELLAGYMASPNRKIFLDRLEVR